MENISNDNNKYIYMKKNKNNVNFEMDKEHIIELCNNKIINMLSKKKKIMIYQILILHFKNTYNEEIYIDVFVFKINIII